MWCKRMDVSVSSVGESDHLQAGTLLRFHSVCIVCIPMCLQHSQHKPEHGLLRVLYGGAETIVVNKRICAVADQRNHRIRCGLPKTLDETRGVVDMTFFYGVIVETWNPP